MGLENNYTKELNKIVIDDCDLNYKDITINDDFLDKIDKSTSILNIFIYKRNDEKAISNLTITQNRLKNLNIYVNSSTIISFSIEDLNDCNMNICFSDCPSIENFDIIRSQINYSTFEVNNLTSINSYLENVHIKIRGRIHLENTSLISSSIELFTAGKKLINTILNIENNRFLVDSYLCIKNINIEKLDEFIHEYSKKCIALNKETRQRHEIQLELYDFFDTNLKTTANIKLELMVSRRKFLYKINKKNGSPLRRILSAISNFILENSSSYFSSFKKLIKWFLKWFLIIYAMDIWMYHYFTAVWNGYTLADWINFWTNMSCETMKIMYLGSLSDLLASSATLGIISPNPALFKVFTCSFCGLNGMFVLSSFIAIATTKGAYYSKLK